MSRNSVRSSEPPSRNRIRSRCITRATRVSVSDPDTRGAAVGVGELLREGRQILIVGFGPIVERGPAGGELLEKDGCRSA